MATGLEEVLQFAVAVVLPLAGHGDALTLKGDIMSLQSRLAALKDRHGSLESQIAREDQRPRPDEAALTRLKLEKLRLKDEIERLRVDLSKSQPHLMPTS